ncbi:hypothetical protein BRADI_4g43411v3 [Brachypodium distachyon]|uniref:Uncharacterized protein n=1 Tax=Brachypodium distachyon TaxID=15368 RepID=A0A0Q3PSC0_BRADI|nr:hypothetical protein BRADI_4g43411v3 [Brachypodium distachyon]
MSMVIIPISLLPPLSELCIKGRQSPLYTFFFATFSAVTCPRAWRVVRGGEEPVVPSAAPFPSSLPYFYL